MRTVLIVAVIMAASGSYLAKVAERLDLPLPAKTDSQSSAMNAYAMTPEMSGTRRVSLQSDRSGHFRTEARVDGRDLDFLVEFGPLPKGEYASAFFGLKAALEHLFGRPVDLVVASSIRNPYFRQSVEQSKALLYAA